MWGWIKELLVAILPFLKDTAKEIVTTEIKTTEAKTTDETKERFSQLRDRIKQAPPPEPPAAGR